jgi:hypothetical protein
MEALKQCDEQGIGFYGKEYPIFVRLTAYIPRGRRWPEFASAVKWTWDLFEGRLWHRKPKCVGFSALVVPVTTENYMGTEIILERRDI